MDNAIKVAGRYVVERKLGSGAFGEVFAGTDVYTRQKVAMKVERTELQESPLMTECEVYRTLRGICGIPAVQWAGNVGHHNVMVMDRLGPNLQDLLDQCGGRLSLKSVLMLADQLLRRIESVHSHGYLHRDIKPENIAIGKVGDYTEDKNVCYLIDFGLSKRYLDPRSNAHISYREDKWVIGTFRYASISAHQGIEQSRRDDLQSLGYTLLYLLKGALPWQGMQVASRAAKNRQVAAFKKSTALPSLCEGCPPEFREYLKYCLQLRFESSPDYSFLRRQFRALFDRQGFTDDNIYDWDCPPPVPVPMPVPCNDKDNAVATADGCLNDSPWSCTAVGRVQQTHTQSQPPIKQPHLQPQQAQQPQQQRRNSPVSIAAVPEEPLCQVTWHHNRGVSKAAANNISSGDGDNITCTCAGCSCSLVTALDFSALA